MRNRYLPVEKYDTEKREQSASSSPFIQRIFLGEDDQMEVIGFSLSPLKSAITWTFYLVTFGLLRLFFHWFPQYKLYATHSKSPLGIAEKVLIINTYKGRFKSYLVKDINVTDRKEGESETARPPLTVRLENGEEKELSLVRAFRCKKITYVWDPEKEKFIRLVGLDCGSWHGDLHRYKGYTSQEQYFKRIVYGFNEITVPVQSVFTLFVLEALTPFYIFQAFSIILWVAEQYFYYGIAIVIMSAYGLSSSIIQTRKNQKNLRGSVTITENVTVCRENGKFEKVSASLLVPGDVLVIPMEGCEMQCDAVLINGSCTVNESMLTGESVPINKTALPNDTARYMVAEDAAHTLFCGTKVIQTKFYGDDTKILAVVIRTGYLTTKGELVRSIMYPPPADFKFDQDSYKVIAILTVVSIIGMIYTIIAKSSRRLPFLDILIKSLDLVTIAIPPALPAAMTVGKLYALRRLKKNKIYCINSRVINVSGSIDCVCFDKTGTLTEDELDMWGVLTVTDDKIEHIKDLNQLNEDNLLFRGMLSCHTLTVIDGKVCGYPLDVKMFESTKWLIEVPRTDGIAGLQCVIKSDPHVHKNSARLEILAAFQFSSNLQKQSVICRDGTTGALDVFCKGSPETVIALCAMPDLLRERVLIELKRFTERGYRVIAMGHKRLMIGTNYAEMLRNDVESDLNFIGLIVLENKLKKQTKTAINILKDAGLKTVMITGDNILTAVSVANECGILHKDGVTVQVVADPLKTNEENIAYHTLSSKGAKSDTFTEMLNGSTMTTRIDPESGEVGRRVQYVISGKSWANLVEFYPEHIPRIVSNGAVFARMSGIQKQQLIEMLKNSGCYVAMCGDGANDCAALKAAHLGISLSEAEASIAAPFTSRQPDISCVPTVIREGRSALTTSFGVFKFMVCGSLTEFFCTVILYGIDCNLSSMQFLFIDLFLQLNFASFFGKTKASDRLNASAPAASLLTVTPIVSMFVFMLETIFFQLIAFYLIRDYDFYRPYVYRPFQGLQEAKCQENFSIFVICMFQYISMAVIFSKGAPHRKPFYTNTLMMSSVGVTVVLCVYLATFPANWIVRLLEMQVPPVAGVKIKLLALAALNFIIAFLVEDYLIEKVLENSRFKNFIKKKWR